VIGKRGVGKTQEKTVEKRDLKGKEGTQGKKRKKRLSETKGMTISDRGSGKTVEW